MTWSKTDKAIIKEMWEGGSSASEIAAYFKTTRGAISGLCDRNRWQCPHKKGHRKGGRKPRVYYGPRTESKRMRITGPNYMCEVEVSEADAIFSTAEFDAQIPVEQRKQLLNLKDRDCRWPVGNPRDNDFFFCGAAAADDKPYCAFHCRAAYMPERQPSGQFALRKWKTSAGFNL